jgi:hypothetical protein
MEMTIGSLSFYVGPLGSTRLLDPAKSGPSASKIKRITTFGSSMGSSSEVNSPVSLTATEDMQKRLEEFDEIRGKPDMEAIVVKSHDSPRDFAIGSSGVSRSVHQLCVIITEAAEENNYEGNKEVDMQVDKPRSNSKKEKEKIHVSTGEWRIIMSAINHGTKVPTDSRREVLMGYQYALHQRIKELRKERNMFMRSRDNNSTSSGGYWDEYSDASESSMERHRDSKRNKRTTTQTREESYTKSLSTHPSDEERTLCARNTRSSIGSSTGVPTNHTTKAWRSTGAHASSRNTKPLVDRGQANGKSSREKGDTSKGRTKGRVQVQILVKRIQ